VAFLPFLSTKHAELGSAQACHVVAAFLQFYKRVALVALLPLPALLLGDAEQFVCFWVMRARLRLVPPPFACGADFGLAFWANSHLATVALSLDNIATREERIAFLGRAVGRVLHSVFCKLLVPFHLELFVEEVIDNGHGYRVLGATFWGHVLRIIERKPEVPFQTAKTHPMPTLELGNFAGRELVHAHYTFDPRPIHA